MLLLLLNQIADSVEIETVNSTTKFFYNSYIVQIFGGILLSCIGLFLIWFLRPKVKISPQIAKRVENNKNIFQFKVINKSYLFQLVDIHFELTILRPVTTPKGMNIALKEVPLNSNHVWFLSRRKRKGKKSKDYATYAIILTVDQGHDLSEIWQKHSKDGTYFDLKVIAKNNFSGITSIHHEEFNHISCIKNGEFCHGNSMEIENTD